MDFQEVIRQVVCREVLTEGIEILNKYYVGENMDKLLNANGLTKLEDMTMVKASEIIKNLEEVAKKEEDR